MTNPEQPTDDPSGPPEWTAERVTSGKAGRYVVAAALLGGGVALGATLSPVSLAGAQTASATDGDEPDSADTDDGTDEADSVDEAEGGDDADEDESDRRGRRGRRGHRGQRSETAAELLGMTTDELRSELRDGSTLAELAEEQGVPEDELVAGLVAAAEAKVAEAVAEGRLDAEEAEDRLAAVAERIDAMVNGEYEREGHGDRRGRGHGRFGLRGLSDAIESLGITADEARTGLAEGKSLAEVAGEQGVAEEDLVAALVAAAEERVDEALAAGRIDADRAEEINDSIADRVAALIDRTAGDHGDHGEGETEESSFST